MRLHYGNGMAELQTAEFKHLQISAEYERRFEEILL
jgi:hypothetical protein